MVKEGIRETLSLSLELKGGWVQDLGGLSSGVVCVNHSMTRPPNILKEEGLGIMVPLGLCVRLRLGGRGRYVVY